MEPKRLIALPEPIAGVPCTETGLMRLYEALAIVERQMPVEPHYRAIFFSSARIFAPDPMYTKTFDFGVAIGSNDIDGATGGGPSHMEAFNAGIIEGKRRINGQARSYGLGVDFYPDEKPSQFLERPYTHRNFATRLHQFARLGHGRCFIVAPDAGIGSALEVMWILQLLQAKQLGDALFLLVGDMWPELTDWMRRWMLSRGTIKESDLHLGRLVATYDDALPLILEHHARFKQLKAAG